MTIAVSKLVPPKLGNVGDYVFGSMAGWDAFQVVRWHGIEELSRPYEYRITLLRPAALGPVDLDALLDTGATFRVAASARHRLVHGIIAEAAEIERTPAMILYQVLLVPHFWRTKYRRRCRSYRLKSLAQIVASVLENDLPELWPEDACGGAQAMEPMPTEARPPSKSPPGGAFVEPRGCYAIEVAEPAFHDPDYRTFVVQYNESDFVHVSRLLEEVGVSYWFEHAEDGTIMHITDRPGADPAAPEERTYLLDTASTGGAQGKEALHSLCLARRMRSRAVEIEDYDEDEPLEYQGETKRAVAGIDGISRHFEFIRQERFPADTGVVPARARLERFEAERAMAQGTGSVRTLEPGRLFTMQDTDALRDDADLLVVRVEVYATELRPQKTVLDHEPFGFPGVAAGDDYHARFVVLPASVPFRPALATKKRLIHGVQHAIVTAEEFDEPRPEINCEYDGSVRIRLLWDRRPEERGIPSSPAIFVSQAWAGPGYGTVMNPRVGNLVLVAFQDGDPEWPVIVGRVHSDQMPAPLDASEAPWTTMLKTKSTPDSDGANLLQFDDLAGKELILLRAQRDMATQVQHDQATWIGADQSLEIVGDQRAKLGGNRSESITGSVQVGVGGDYALSGSNVSIDGKSVSVRGTSTAVLSAPDTYVTAGDSSEIHVTPDAVKITAPDIVLEGKAHVRITAPDITISDGSGGLINITGGVVTVIGTPIKLNP